MRRRYSKAGYKTLLLYAHSLGYTDRATADELDVSNSTVWRWRQQLGIPRTSPTVYHFNTRYAAQGGIARFRELHALGLSYRQLGACFGFSHQRAHQLARALGLPGRRRAFI